MKLKKKNVDDEQVDCYDMFYKMKKWPQKTERYPKDFYFIPFYHICKDTKILHCYFLYDRTHGERCY